MLIDLEDELRKITTLDRMRRSQRRAGGLLSAGVWRGPKTLRLDRARQFLRQSATDVRVERFEADLAFTQQTEQRFSPTASG